MSKKDQIGYKMLLNMDGVTTTYPGFLWRLLSNSVTLKQEANNVQWFYSEIKPWKHYVPVKRDFSDLIEKINWVIKNDDKAHKIAQNSTEFVQQNLMIEDIDHYIVKILNDYAKIRKGLKVD